MYSGQSLRGHIALIVGGLAPSGRAIARRLAAQGCLVVVADFDDEETADLAERMGAEGLSVQGVGLDATSPESISAAFDLIGQTYGLPNLLCYGVGFHLADESIARAPRKWRQGLISSLGGAGLCASEFADRLLRSSRPQGTIAFLTSDLGEEYNDPLTQVTFAGLKILARSLRQEGKILRINATIVQGGPLPGSGAERTLRGIAEQRGENWDSFSAKWRERYGMDLTTDADSVAEAVLQLMHGECEGIEDFVVRVRPTWTYGAH